MLNISHPRRRQPVVLLNFSHLGSSFLCVCVPCMIRNGCVAKLFLWSVFLPRIPQGSLRIGASSVRRNSAPFVFDL